MTYPSVLKTGMTKRRRNAPEKRLQTSIVRALWDMGFMVTSFSQPQRAMMTAGIPDLFACHYRWRVRVWIEVKTPKGKVSIDQAQWHANAKACGENVVVVRSLEQLVVELKALGAPIQ